MVLNHIGVFNKNEDQAMQFYGHFLGFQKTREFTLPQELSEQLFSVSEDLKILVFEKEGTKIEVFICAHCSQPSPDFSHSGFILKNLSDIIEKAPGAGVELITGNTKEKTVYFIKDFSGNLFEIKQQ